MICTLSVHHIYENNGYMSVSISNDKQINQPIPISYANFGNQALNCPVLHRYIRISVILVIFGKVGRTGQVWGSGSIDYGIKISVDRENV